MPTDLSPPDLARWLQPGTQVYWPGAAGHSPLFEQWLRAQPQCAEGVTFSGAWLPGVNRFDPTALHPAARARSIFAGADWQAALDRGAFDDLPLHYSEAARWFAAPGRFDVALLHVAPPDEHGHCSLSLAADFAPAVLDGAPRVVLAHVNPRLPRTRGPGVPAARIDAWVHAETPPLTLPDEAPDATLAAVAARVASLVRDGDTLQFGLGRLQAAVLAALHSHRGLRVHSGMVSNGLLGLIDAGALAARDAAAPPVCTGVALGSEALYRALADPALVQFAPSSHTHGASVLAALPRFTSINTALEVDLLGQANGEVIGGRQVSGVGGLVDFVRGARASVGGRSIIAFTATVGRDRRSRIVPLLAAGPVSIVRTDIDIVVTEHGVAALRELSTEQRARALIAIAAPEHREALADAWHTLRRTL